MPLKHLVAAVALLPALAVAQAHPGTAGATSVIHEELLDTGPARYPLLPSVSQTFSSFTGQAGTTFADLDVKVRASPSSVNTCWGTIGSFVAAALVKTYLFNLTGIWGTIQEPTLNNILETAITQLVTQAIRFTTQNTLDRLADSITAELEPYRQAAFTQAQARIAVMQILASLTSTVPSSRMSTSASFRTNVTHTPSVTGSTLRNRFDLVSTIDTETTIQTGGMVECMEWLLVNVWTLALYGFSVPEEYFFTTTRVNRSFVPRGQTAYVAQLDLSNQLTLTSADRQLKPTRFQEVLTGAPRDHYDATVVGSEIPDSLKLPGISSEVQFRLQAASHLLSVLEALTLSRYDQATALELRGLNDALNAETFFSWSDTTTAAQFNLFPAVGSLTQRWSGAPAAAAFSTAFGMGSYLATPALDFVQLTGVGSASSGAFVPAALTLTSPASNAEQSVVTAGQQPLYVLRGLEHSLFPTPLGGPEDDFSANVVTRFDLPNPYTDVNVRGRVLSIVSPPSMREVQGQKIIDLTVRLEVTLTRPAQAPLISTADVTFSTPVTEEFYKRTAEQQGDRRGRDWELRFVPGDTVVSSSYPAAGSALITRNELHYLIGELLGPGVLRGIQAMGRDRVGSLHDFGSWGGFQNMARHQQATAWQVGASGPNNWSRLRLDGPSVAPTFDYGVRAPRSTPLSLPLGSQGQLTSKVSTERLPAQITELPAADYAVRVLPDGSTERVVVECRRSIWVQGAQGPVRLHTGYAYARTRVLRGEKKLVLTDGRYFNADDGVGVAKLGATRSNIALTVFDYRNTDIPEACKIYPEDRVYYYADDPSGLPELSLTVMAEYEHGLEKSPQCNPHLKFPRTPYTPLVMQPAGINPTYSSTVTLTSAAPSKRHSVAEQSCGGVSVDLIVSQGGLPDATEPLGTSGEGHPVKIPPVGGAGH